MNKKLLLSLGAIGAIGAPVAAVVACGTESNSNNQSTTVISKEDAKNMVFVITENKGYNEEEGVLTEASKLIKGTVLWDYHTMQEKGNNQYEKVHRKAVVVSYNKATRKLKIERQESGTKTIEEVDVAGLSEGDKIYSVMFDGEKIQVLLKKTEIESIKAANPVDAEKVKKEDSSIPLTIRKTWFIARMKAFANLGMTVEKMAKLTKPEHEAFRVKVEKEQIEIMKNEFHVKFTN